MSEPVKEKKIWPCEEAKAGDLEGTLAVFENPTDGLKSIITKNLDSKEGHVYIARDKPHGKIIGFAIWSKWDTDDDGVVVYSLENFHATESVQGEGVGNSLVRISVGKLGIYRLRVNDKAGHPRLYARWEFKKNTDLSDANSTIVDRDPSTEEELKALLERMWFVTIYYRPRLGKRFTDRHDRSTERNGTSNPYIKSKSTFIIEYF